MEKYFLFQDRYLIEKKISSNFFITTYIALDTFNEHAKVFIYDYNKMNKMIAKKQYNDFVKERIKEKEKLKSLYLDKIVEIDDNYLILELENYISLKELLKLVNLNYNDIKLILEIISLKLKDYQDCYFIDLDLDLILYNVEELNMLFKFNKISKIALIKTLINLDNLVLYNLYYTINDYDKIYSILKLPSKLNFNLNNKFNSNKQNNNLDNFFSDNRIKNIYNGFNSDLSYLEFLNLLQTSNQELKNLYDSNYLYSHNDLLFREYRKIYKNINNFYLKEKHINKKSKTLLVSLITILLLCLNTFLLYSLYQKEPENFKIPNVVALDKKQADKILKENHFNTKVTYQASNAPYGQILSQEPGVNSIVNHKEKVKLKVSAGKYYFMMPKFKNLQEAQNYLYNKNAKYYIQPFRDYSSKNNDIVDTYPQAGKYVYGNDKIIIEAVNNNLNYTNIPNFKSKSLETAKKLAKQNNLKIIVKRINSEYNDNKIIKQEPRAFKRILETSYITLYLADNSYIKVPSLKNKNLIQAKKILKSKKLKYKVIKTKTQKKNEIIKQVPLPGKKVLKNSYILIYS